MKKMFNWIAAAFVAVTALSGCGVVDSATGDSKAVTAGSEIVKKYLRSPSSFALIDGKTVWKGVDKQGRPAYIVRIEFDAQNGFGATIRGCQLAALYFVGDDQFGYRDMPPDSCDGAGLGEEWAIKVEREVNDFVAKEDQAKEKAAAATPVAPAASVAPPAAQATPVAATGGGSPSYQLVTARAGRFGTVSLRTDSASGNTFVFVNKVLMPQDPTGAVPNFRQEWELGNRDIYLMELPSGGNGCPSSYAFVIVEQGAALMSESFGNCSDEPDVAENNGEITIKFPEFGSAPSTSARLADGQVFVTEGSGPEKHAALNRKVI